LTIALEERSCRKDILLRQYFVAWAIGGKHDRPRPERPIFGTVRFMSYESTRTKFNSKACIAWIGDKEKGRE
jgi:deoxyribodipyrimidine photo-lyase